MVIVLWSLCEMVWLTVLCCGQCMRWFVLPCCVVVSVCDGLADRVVLWSVCEMVLADRVVLWTVCEMVWLTVLCCGNCVR